MIESREVIYITVTYKCGCAYAKPVRAFPESERERYWYDDCGRCKVLEEQRQERERVRALARNMNMFQRRKTLAVRRRYE